MDILKLFSYLFLGFFYSNFHPAQGQWGLRWGSPGSLKNLKTVKLLGNLKKATKHSKVLWRPMKHDIVIARDSSDSSDNSDTHRRRFIKKLKRRLSRRKRIKLRRRNANALIEKLIKEKILRTKKEPNKNVKSDQMEPRIHSIDKGNQNVKPLTKTSLVKTLGERLLSDYDYTTIIPNGKESTGLVVSWDGIFTANKNVKSSRKSVAVGNLGHSFKKTSSSGIGVSTPPKSNANTNAEQEFEAEIETEEPVITTTEKNIFLTSKQNNGEQEIEAEETTAQNIISTIRTLSSSAASSNNGEQEIEAEETTTINSITTVKSHLSKSTAVGEQEVEIEGITSTTKTSVTQQTSATVDQEVEAEETTTPLYSKSTKILVSSINDHQRKQRVIGNAVANKYHGIAGIYIKPKSLDKPLITAQIAGVTRQKTEIPLNNGNFSYITKGELSISGKKLPLVINSVNSKSILNKDVNGHLMGSERKFDMNSFIKHPQKVLGSYHPPVPAEEAVVSVQGDVSVISSLDKNIIKTKTTLGKVGSGRRRVDDNGKPGLKHLADLNSTTGLRSSTLNPSDKETLEFSGNVFKTQPSLNVQVRTRVSKDKTDKTSGTHLSAHFTPISTIPLNSTSFVAPAKHQKTIHTIRINGQSKPSINHIAHGTRRHISLSGKDHFKLQRHGITYLQPTIEVAKKKGITQDQQNGNGVAAKLNKKNIFGQKNKNNSPQINDGRQPSNNFILNVGGNASVKTISQEPHDKTFTAGRRTLNIFNNAHLKTGNGVAFKLNKNTISRKRTLNNLPQINDDRQSSNGILNAVGNAPGKTMSQKSIDKTVTAAGRNNIKQVSLGPAKSLPPFLHITAPIVNANENTRNAQNQIQNWKPVVHSNSIMNEIHTRTIGSKDTGLNHTPKSNSFSKSIQKENRSGIKPKKLSWQHRATSKPVVQQKAFVNNPPNPLPIAWGPVATSNTVIKEKKLGPAGIPGQQQKSWGPIAAGKPSLNQKDTNVEIANDIQWASVATSKPSPDKKNINVEIGNNIQWGPVAKSKPSLGKKKINEEIGNNIQWGPVATSKPASTEKPASINYIQTHKNISWGPVATSIPVVTGQQIKIQDRETNKDVSRQQITKNSHGSSGTVSTNNVLHHAQKTTSHMSGLSRGLLDQLRPPSMRNLGSNRGRLTIMDAGNSSNVLPMPNGKAKDQIQNKIKADEILTSKWLDSKRKEATVLATELGGIWKGLLPGTKRQNVNKSGKTRGTVPMSTTGIDPITFRWSPTWT
ncbi:uncharacterized protein LOC134720924 isoform X2 [Mytilus trossulus]|uniref:uncharacterized protein LOC134720924 isoform X2 n=1 Tax=Mytilus trossulus TaxID=6551 RepID=UPI003004EA46